MARADYDVKPIRAPRAAGGKLRFLTGLLEGPLGGALAGTLLRQAGVLGLRDAQTDDPLPIRPPLPPAPGEAPDAAAIDAELLERLPRPPAPEGFRPETIADLAAAYRRGEATPGQVARRVLEHTRRSDELRPPMRFFIAQREEDVLAQAEAATRRFAEGRPLGPLDGVPVAVKDEIDQAGYPTTVGTRFLGGAPAERDATAVARLRGAGAVLIGKANMHEIGLGVTGLNPHHGPARNPHGPERAAGGSSSGPAAVVAAGLCPLAVGADGGGSIRIPAAFCGVVGLKPTYGRVSEHGAAPLCWSVAHLGPLAATARDAAIGWALMAGPDPADPNTLGHPAPRLHGFGETDLRGFRLGVFEPWFEHAEPPVLEACRRMLDGLQSLGAALESVDLPELGLLRTVHLVTIVSEMYASQLAHRAGHRKHYAHDTRLNMNLASRLSAADYVHAQRLRVRLSGHFYRALERVDAIVTPATGRTAPVLPRDALRTGESNLRVLDQIMRFAPAANLAGLPAVSFPAGYDDAGLPIGCQAIGRAWEEHRLLRLAAAAGTLVARREPQVLFRLLA